MIYYLFCHVVPIYVYRWLVVMSLLLGWPVSLLAHSTLSRAEPPVNSQVAAAPSTVRLWFNESVEQRFSQVTVHRAKRDTATGKLQLQQRVDEGLIPGPRVTRELAVKLPESLLPGLYLVQWKVLSIDSHRTTGKFTLTYEPQMDKANPPPLEVVCRHHVRLSQSYSLCLALAPLRCPGFLARRVVADLWRYGRYR